jgi:quinol monooxygenase YgiN
MDTRADRGHRLDRRLHVSPYRDDGVSLAYRRRMTRVSLSGSLICADSAQAALVERLLPRHVALTREEHGCLSFEVTRTDDPLVWCVTELFVDRAAFDAHQARVAASEWGRETVGIRRDYAVASEPG